MHIVGNPLEEIGIGLELRIGNSLARQGATQCLHQRGGMCKVANFVLSSKIWGTLRLAHLWRVTYNPSIHLLIPLGALNDTVQGVKRGCSGGGV